MSTRERARASPSAKLPVIDTSPENDGAFTVGQDCTTSSRTMASWRLGQVDSPLKHSLASTFQAASPEPVRLTTTVQPCCWSSSTPALSRENTSPVPPEGPTTHEPPSRVRSTSVCRCARSARRARVVAGTVEPVSGTLAGGAVVVVGGSVGGDGDRS